MGHRHRFHFPNSAMPDMPISKPNSTISFGLVEIGCRPKGKSGQLRSKRQLMLDYWQEAYGDVSFEPHIYRMLVHYQHDDGWNPRQGDFIPDTMIVYRSIPHEAILALSDAQRHGILKAARNSGKQDRVEKMLRRGESRQLHEMITEGSHDQRLSGLRGKVAELLAQRDISYFKPKSMRSFTNGTIKYFNDRYRSGTEIDQILVFYNQRPYQTLVGRLESCNHLEVFSAEDLERLASESKAA